MKKKNIKNNEQDGLNSKAIELSNIIEQGLEDVLNELIAHNYRQYNSGFDNIIKNKSVANKLCEEIKEISQNLLASYKDKNLLLFTLLHKEENFSYRYFINEITRIMKFANHLKDISNTLELIKTNINELYKYPTFKKQAYIPEFSLALSAFFKENIDIFFMQLGKDEEIKNKVASELSKIISLGNKIINEFFRNITCENINNIKDTSNQVIYYSSIISLLELISINSVEFTFI